MRAMKGLLLGTAAGLIAVAGAQAADLPVKAKPVEYVKICSLYGAGFFYVPGTDTCLKLGMYLRAEHDYNVGSGTYNLPGGTQRFTRADTRNYNYRARMALSTDWRTQSDYGVIRAYALLIFQQGSDTDVPFPSGPSAQGIAGMHRAFIQFAGFTVGHAVSYFDFFNGAAYGYSPSIWIGSTGVVGTDLIAYTWQLGNGWSASIDIEDGRIGRNANVNNVSVATGAWLVGGPAPGAANSIQPIPAPDIAGNIRVDQAWGSAQIMAAAHNMSATYYGATTLTGHPSDTYGWAIGGGFKISNFLNPKDDLEFQIDYAKGATSYIYSIYNANTWFDSGNSVGLGWSSDGIYSGLTAATGTSIERTEAWGFAAAYQHYWNPQWRTSVVGGYTEINYNATATALICGAAPAAPTVFGGLVTAVTNCSPNFSLSAISTRTAWNPHPTLEIGLDLIYAHINTAFAGTATLPAAGARPTGTYVIEDQDYWGVILRFQKTLLP